MVVKSGEFVVNFSNTVSDDNSYRLMQSFMSQENALVEEVKIRKARAADADALAFLVAERGFDYPTDKSSVAERFKNLNRASDCILVAVYKAQIVGMILLHQTRFLHRQPDGRISSLVVSEKFRSCGIGKILVAEAEKVFRKWRCGRIEVTSGLKRERAHEFYEREGFKTTAKRFTKILDERKS